MSKYFIKRPGAELDYTVDWSRWLDGDTITASTWELDDGIENDGDTRTLTSATVWLSGGTDDANYSVTNRIVTAAGRKDARSFTIKVRA